MTWFFRFFPEKLISVRKAYSHSYVYIYVCVCEVSSLTFQSLIYPNYEVQVCSVRGGLCPRGSLRGDGRWWVSRALCCAIGGHGRRYRWGHRSLLPATSRLCGRLHQTHSKWGAQPEAFLGAVAFGAGCSFLQSDSGREETSRTTLVPPHISQQSSVQSTARTSEDVLHVLRGSDAPWREADGSVLCGWLVCVRPSPHLP